MDITPELPEQDSEQTHVDPYDLLGDLRDCEERERQEKIVQELLSQAKVLKEKLQEGSGVDPAVASKYGRVMDQTIVNLPEEKNRSDRVFGLQQEALQELTDHFYEQPAPEVAREIFMLYHHGAGTSKQAHKTYEKYFNEETENTSFAREYLHSERIAGDWLNESLVRYFDDDHIKIDIDDEVVEKMMVHAYDNDTIESLMMDVANYYRRRAYYQKMLSAPYDSMFVEQARLAYEYFADEYPESRTGLQELKSEFDL